MNRTPRRVALVNDASGYVGPALARELASRGHDLVLGSPSPELIAELERSRPAMDLAGWLRSPFADAVTACGAATSTRNGSTRALSRST